MVNECTTHPEMCAGHIPTEIGRLTAMKSLELHQNQLTGAPLIAHKSGLVNEFTTVETALTRPHSNGDWAVPPVEKAFAQYE